MDILFLLYLFLWFWDFNIKNLQDFIKIYRALIKDIFLPSYVEDPWCKNSHPGAPRWKHTSTMYAWEQIPKRTT